MDERRWLTSNDKAAMLEYLRSSGNASERKLRLFACACCRMFWHLLEDDRSRKAVEVSERYADGLATKAEVTSARRELKADFRNRHRAAIATSVSEQSAFRWAFGWDVAAFALRAKSSDAARLGIFALATASRFDLIANARQSECPVEDMFSNPFRPVTIASAWLTDNVVRLAEAAYDDRLPDGRLDNCRLAVVSDALEVAGCEDTAILGHLRSGGEHWRGCHAVDAILGKS